MSRAKEANNARKRLINGALPSSIADVVHGRCDCDKLPVLLPSYRLLQLRIYDGKSCVGGRLCTEISHNYFFVRFPRVGSNESFIFVETGSLQVSSQKPPKLSRPYFLKLQWKI